MASGKQKVIVSLFFPHERSPSRGMRHAMLICHSFLYSCMNSPPFNEDPLMDIEHFRLHMKDCRERAEEIVRDRGWSEKDDDFEFQIEMETRNQWDEDMEREQEKYMPWFPDGFLD